MTTYLMGLDSGLTVTKAVIFREDGSVVATGKCGVPQIKDRPHFVERDMQAHWHAVAQAIREALAAAAEAEGQRIMPSAVSVSGHGDGVYLIDKAGQPLGYAATSLDSRAQKIVEGWDADGTSEKALALTGQRPFPAAPSALLAYWKRNEPERYAAIGSILSCKDWMRFALTGKAATDFTESSVSFVDVKTQKYSDEALALYDLTEMRNALPEVLLPDEIAGHVTAEAAALTGLDEGIPVATGLHDVIACAVGAGVTGSGTLAVIAGTYSINEQFRDQPETHPDWLCRNGLYPGQWYNMSISPASSATLDWFLSQTAKDALATDDPFGLLQAELDAVANDPSEVIYLPYLYGSPHRNDVPGAFIGMRGWHNRGHLLRAVGEGIAFNHRHHVDILDPERTTEHLRLTGGSSRNPYFAQIFADAMNRKIEVPETLETGALGAAICAGLAIGIYSDWADAAVRTASTTLTYEPDAQHLSAQWDRYQEAARTIAALHERI
ncbi:carbohydrate kinase [Marivivens donghaensis]|uniref:Carbohydrate kinase n=1 Tax=Marivivens donghaensis TaxID=1699413 RepID=A0ABX0W0T5_9RHOB|nr:FGGY-family carbohydrate kinase [Marivivens donghaensis]NIY73941.1 carbohydrate kinase [Marivivens donghaensis]